MFPLCFSKQNTIYFWQPQIHTHHKFAFGWSLQAYNVGKLSNMHSPAPGHVWSGTQKHRDIWYHYLWRRSTWKATLAYIAHFVAYIFDLGKLTFLDLALISYLYSGADICLACNPELLRELKERIGKHIGKYIPCLEVMLFIYFFWAKYCVLFATKLSSKWLKPC